MMDLVIRSAEFVKAAVKPEHYPPEALPEIAFAGRSNVGKSSLINCLLQRRKLVRTSRTPGQTQTINFFSVNGAFTFVDLPGYGFARVPEKVRAAWGPMVETYLTRRRTLLGIVQIIDLRHPPTPDDLNLWNWLKERHIRAVPVLTKADKLKPSQVPSHLKQAALSLGVPAADLIPFSAVTQLGRQALLDALLLWLSQNPPTP